MPSSTSAGTCSTDSARCGTNFICIATGQQTARHTPDDFSQTRMLQLDRTAQSRHDSALHGIGRGARKRLPVAVTPGNPRRPLPQRLLHQG